MKARVEISDRLVYELKSLLTANNLRIRLLSGLGDVKNLAQNVLIPNASCHFKGHQINLHSYHSEEPPEQAKSPQEPNQD